MATEKITPQTSAAYNITWRYGTEADRQLLREHGPDAPLLTPAEAIAAVAGDATSTGTVPGFMTGQAGPAVEREDIRDALWLVGPAREQIERAELILLGHARAAGLPWHQINDLLGYPDDLRGRQAQTRYKRLTERFPDVAAPSPAHHSGPCHQGQSSFA